MKKLRYYILFALLSAAALAGWQAYKLFGAAVNSGVSVSVRLRSSWTADTLVNELQNKAGLKDPKAFVWWMQKLGYLKLRPCTIEIPAGASIYKIVQILKANRYQTVDVTIRGSMKAEKLAAMLYSKLEVMPDSFLKALKDSNIYQTGFNDTTWPALLIPNTYNFSVAATTADFFARMKKEYDLFWNEDRLGLAEKQSLSPLEVAIIASIVTKESNKTDEYENIAGVYINRLRIGMELGADPTITFARGYEGRVLKKDLQIESPYNTYEHKGLPPGPICIPNVSALNAVLNYSGHNYLYFVADPAMNGYHHFSKTLVEHNIWAAKFRLAAWSKNRKN